MFCRLCKKHTIEGSAGCGHFAPHNIYAEKRNDKYVLMEKSGGLRTQGKWRYWPETKGMSFNNPNEAYDYAWKVKNGGII